jgi:hypothetical protein
MSQADLQGLAIEIQRNNRSLIREFRIDTSPEGLVLRGVAYSFYGKQVALSEVQRRTGQVLANRIEVAS